MHCVYVTGVWEIRGLPADLPVGERVIVVRIPSPADLTADAARRERFMAWESARFVPVALPALIEEYQHVLAYPEIADLIHPELRRAFRSHLLDDIELVAPIEMPRICRDADDDKVIAAAYKPLIRLFSGICAPSIVGQFNPTWPLIADLRATV